MIDYELLQKKINSFPRTNLACLPTPLEKLERFSSVLNMDNIYIKRDDQTGLAFGGNKTRKLEFIMADAMNKKADSVISWGGIQSNWCRQVAAAANRMNMKSVLVLFKKDNFPDQCDGNYFLNKILGAKIRIIEIEKQKKTFELRDIKEIIDKVIEDEKKQGNNPYVIPAGGSLLEGSMERSFGAISYVDAFLEIFAQVKRKGIRLDKIIFAIASGSTQAGLIVGTKILSPSTKIVGITVNEDKKTMREYVKNIAARTLEELDLSLNIADKDVIIFDEYIKEGYGIINNEVIEAMYLLAKTEGILLDPVYTGKAMVAFIDLTKQKFFKKGENILFIHTGGTPALFAYKENLLRKMGYINKLE